MRARTKTYGQHYRRKVGEETGRYVFQSIVQRQWHSDSLLSTPFFLSNQPFIACVFYLPVYPKIELLLPTAERVQNWNCNRNDRGDVVHTISIKIKQKSRGRDWLFRLVGSQRIGRCENEKHTASTD